MPKSYRSGSKANDEVNVFFKYKKFVKKLLAKYQMSGVCYNYKNST